MFGFFFFVNFDFSMFVFFLGRGTGGLVKIKTPPYFHQASSDELVLAVGGSWSLPNRNTLGVCSDPETAQRAEAEGIQSAAEE